MKIGLTFDEYVDLTVKPHEGASDVFIQAAARKVLQKFGLGQSGRRPKVNLGKFRTVVEAFEYQKRFKTNFLLLYYKGGR